MNNHKLVQFAILLLLGVTTLMGCKPDPDPDPEPTPDPYGAGVYVVNEGGFQQGNGTISYYEPTAKTLENGIFQAVNGVPLGDIVQSLTFYEDKAFIAVNNSNLVYAVNAGTMEYIMEIGVSSPRFLLPVGNGKGYMTTLFASEVRVMDLDAVSSPNGIQSDAWTEDLHLKNGKVFITKTGGSEVLVVDPNTDQITNQIVLNKEPNSIAEDKNGKLWVLCSGGYQDTVPGLYQIDAQTETVEASFVWTSNLASPGKLTMNPGQDTLYWLDDGVWRMPISASTLPGSAWIPQNGSFFYGLGVDPGSGEVYVSDAVDFSGNGWVYRYSPLSTMIIDSFQVGVSPNGFVFQ